MRSATTDAPVGERFGGLDDAARVALGLLLQAGLGVEIGRGREVIFHAVGEIEEMRDGFGIDFFQGIGALQGEVVIVQAGLLAEEILDLSLHVGELPGEGFEFLALGFLELVDHHLQADLDLGLGLLGAGLLILALGVGALAHLGGDVLLLAGLSGLLHRL